MESSAHCSHFSFLELSGTESLLTSSQYARVVFHNVAERFDASRDLCCRYSSQSEEFSAGPGDRVVLFKLGWQAVTDYELFEWAPVPDGSGKSLVVFRAQHLPRDSHEFYQFCYVDSENAICGASVPFQFSRGETDPLSHAEEQSQADHDSFVQVREERGAADGCSGCTELRQQKDQLEQSLVQRYDRQMAELRADMVTLRGLLGATQTDVCDLRRRLQLAGEEFRKLYAEKRHAERRYERLARRCQARRRGSDSGEPEPPDELEPFPAFPFPLNPLSP